MDNKEFYTLKGYSLHEHEPITTAMEDYLEMICRISSTDGYVRVSKLSDKLNVRPSSVSKMVRQLADLNLVECEKYGIIKPSGHGWEVGNYLLYRHDILNQFFCIINKTENELEQTEKVEHFINRSTLINISEFVQNYNKQK